MNKNRKSTVKKNVFLVIILALLVALIGGTYARYSSTATGSGNVDIAKWSVKVNGTDISTASSTFDLTFTTTGKGVVTGKIAPSVTAASEVQVDLTGTEVDVEFECKLSDEATSKLEEVFGVGASSRVILQTGTPTVEGEDNNMSLDGAQKIVTITDKSKGMKGSVKVPITLEWKNDEEKNTEDTKAGASEEPKQITIPVDITVKQHIQASEAA